MLGFQIIIYIRGLKGGRLFEEWALIRGSAGNMVSMSLNLFNLLSIAICLHSVLVLEIGSERYECKISRKPGERQRNFKSTHRKASMVFISFSLRF